MKKCLLPVVSILFLAHLSSAEKISHVCKSPEVADRCFQAHGRLIYGNGTPAMRLWQIGTHHEFGIYSSLQGYRCDQNGKCLDNESPNLPPGVEKFVYVPVPYGPPVFADFEVCPLEPHIPGHMQAACIKSATHLFIQKN
jgi:hypothetical protein